jgi:ribosomal-protein-alanine N-acetyltransferase
VQLETERLILRDFAPDDVGALAACRADERYWRFYDPPDDVTDGARQHVEMFVAWQQGEPRTHFQLAITLKETGRVIGDCGLRQRTELVFGETSSDEGDIGYELDPGYWGQGYATEAIRAIVAFGFEELGLHRIWTACVADNERSWLLIERIGMRREGLLRQNVWLRGRWWDTLVYAFLRDEWSAQQRS